MALNTIEFRLERELHFRIGGEHSTGNTMTMRPNQAEVPNHATTFPFHMRDHWLGVGDRHP